VFAGEATYIVNRVQADDLAAKGTSYLGMFTQLGEAVARQLEGVTLRAPDVVYDGSYDLDLGGRVVHLRPTGRGHTKGDQVITVPDAGVMFTGDLAETAQFPIMPYFPPFDTDVSGLGWLAVMQRLIDERPQVVVPGHGAIGGSQLLADVRDYITERSCTRRVSRRASGYPARACSACSSRVRAPRPPRRSSEASVDPLSATIPVRICSSGRSPSSAANSGYIMIWW
jgi:glyoxylase-like metal-dependent hydrolase (beta-lactamase superfamily II)